MSIEKLGGNSNSLDQITRCHGVPWFIKLQDQTSFDSYFYNNPAQLEDNILFYLYNNPAHHYNG